MPSCWQTRRAVLDIGHRASTPSLEGATPELHRRPTYFMPSRSIRAAATDESTPPDIATRTRNFSPLLPMAGMTEPPRRETAAGYGLQARADLGIRGRVPESQPEGTERNLSRKPWYRTWLGSIAPLGHIDRFRQERSDPYPSEQDEQRLALDTVDHEVAVAGQFPPALVRLSWAPGMAANRPLFNVSRSRRARSQATTRCWLAASRAAAMPTTPATL